MKNYSWLVCLLTLSACASVSDVTPIGDGKYTVGSEVRGGMTSWSEVQAMAIKRASEYCAAHGKEISDTAVATHGTQGWTPQAADVTFKCKTKT